MPSASPQRCCSSGRIGAIGTPGSESPGIWEGRSPASRSRSGAQVLRRTSKSPSESALAVEDTHRPVSRWARKAWTSTMRAACSMFDGSFSAIHAILSSAGVVFGCFPDNSWTCGDPRRRIGSPARESSQRMAGRCAAPSRSSSANVSR
ncbi:MAG: hypothetical protein LKI58_01385 [Actinomyces sp.]|nr:hypothetical protein [Actinomyces sp.]MCI1786710.1 hypothetical protein [Actinomyces sp.]